MRDAPIPVRVLSGGGKSPRRFQGQGIGRRRNQNFQLDRTSCRTQGEQGGGGEGTILKTALTPGRSGGSSSRKEKGRKIKT